MHRKRQLIQLLGAGVLGLGVVLFFNLGLASGLGLLKRVTVSESGRQSKNHALDAAGGVVAFESDADFFNESIGLMAVAGPVDCDDFAGLVNRYRPNAADTASAVWVDFGKVREPT